MLYTLDTRTILPRAMAYIRASCTPATFPSLLAKTRLEMLSHLSVQGVGASGPTFVRYYQIDEQRLDVEVGVLLAQPIDETDTIHIGELPGGLVALARHIGPYSELGKLYVAMQDWVEQQGYVLAGAPWEIYWTDPQDEASSGRWKADVIWPVK
jgi:effector-binding domain-containing protein